MPVVDLEQVEALCTSLRSSTSTARRRTIKELMEVIEREYNRVAITAMISAGRNSMWVRLVKNAKYAATLEVAAAERRNSPPRTDEADCLWKLVRFSDDKSKQLGPVVAELLKHVGDTLEDDLARAPYGQHYTQILCKILEEPEYCEQISRKLFESTMHTLLRVLEQSQGSWDMREHRRAAPYARGLQLLLSGYGKDIHEYLDPLIRFFSQWCASLQDAGNTHGTSSLAGLPSIFEALKTLLQLYGTACAPMLRKDGWGVLSFVLRTFRGAQRTQRECMLEYLRLHLRIAGATRDGCADGERDRIFDAVPNLYRLLVNEQQIAEAVGSGALHPIGGGGGGQRRAARGGSTLRFSLERRGRMHLLLCADLVHFYRRLEGMTLLGSAVESSNATQHERGELSKDGEGEEDDVGMDDDDDRAAPRGVRGTKSKKRARQVEGPGDADSNHLAAGGGRPVTARSTEGGTGGNDWRKRSRAVTDPWEDILGTLHAKAPLSLGRTSGREQPPIVLRMGANRHSPTAVDGSSGSGRGTAGSSGPSGGGSTSAVHVLPWLQLLAVVLEAYPEGGCWRPQDTAIELARAVLTAEAHLKSSSDQSVHLWALICLLRAADASGAHLARNSRGASFGSPTGANGEHNGLEGPRDGLAVGKLAEAWRSAWETLLRADLRFSNPTARCESGGVGEAVLAVLGACMRECLMDPAFVTKEQDRLWALPLFRTPMRNSANVLYSPEPFRLITAFFRQGDLLEGRDAICTHMQGYPGPAAARSPHSGPDVNNHSHGSSSDAPRVEQSPLSSPPATGVIATPLVGGGSASRRQTRRRWRLLQYLLGWLEAAAVGSGGGSLRGGGLASVESEEALAAAVAALVAVSCPGPPPAEQGEHGVSIFDGNIGGHVRTRASRGGRGGGGPNRRRFQRPFIVEIAQTPCPTIAAEAAAYGVGGSIVHSGNHLAAVADGVWGGVLDDFGPTRRRRSPDVATTRSVSATASGWVTCMAAEVWGLDMGMGRAGEGGDIPAYVGFAAGTLKECEPLLEDAAIDTLPPAQHESPTHIGVDGVGGSRGGSNMVSRDDTASMHRLIARWLRKESERLAGIAAQPTTAPADRARSLRALLHATGILAVFFSRACETGVDHPDLESALWASTTAAVSALKHVLEAADYVSLCEGLARLHRVVGCLLRVTSSAGQLKEGASQESDEADGSASSLADILRFCSRLVRDWHKGRLPELAPVAMSPRASSDARGLSQTWASASGTAAAAGGRGGRRFRGRGSVPSPYRTSPTAEDVLADSVRGGGGRISPTQGGFSDDDDMMDDEDDGFSVGASGAGGSSGVGGGAWGQNGGNSSAGAGRVSASQISSTQAGGGSGGAGVVGGVGVSGDGRLFGEGREPGGALKGAVVWCARLSLAITPNPATAQRLCQVFEKAYVKEVVDESELFAVAREAGEACYSAEERQDHESQANGRDGDNYASAGGDGGDENKDGLSLVCSAVRLVLSYADPSDISSNWMLRALAVVQRALVARGPRRTSHPMYGDSEGEAAVVTGRVLAKLTDAVFKDKMMLAGKKRSRLVRAAHLSAAHALFDANPNGPAKDLFASCVFDAAKDPDSLVRAAAGAATRVLFRRFKPDKHQAIYKTVMSKLPPVVEVDEEIDVEGPGDELEGDKITLSAEAYATLAAASGKGENEIRYYVIARREFEATSLAAVKDMAASSARVTRPALDHLLRRSVRPELARAVGRLTQELGEGLGFSSGPALLREHSMFFMSQWLDEWSSLDGFPFGLLGHARGRKEALQACAHVAVPLVVVQLARADRLKEVQAIAGDLGMGATDNGVARLMKLHMADIKAVYLPLLYTEDSGDGSGAQKDAFVANAADDFLQRVIDGGKAGRMSDNLQTLVLRLLDIGVMEPFGVFARITLRSIAETLEQVARHLEGSGGQGGVGGGGGGAGVSGAGDLLRRINFVEVMLHLRGHISRSRGLEAQRRVFSMLKFVITKACVEEDASCLASTISVLLWLLEVRVAELMSRTSSSTNGSSRNEEVDDGRDATDDGGATAAVVLLKEVMMRCTSSREGQGLLDKHLGAVVEKLVAVFTDLWTAQKDIASLPSVSYSQQRLERRTSDDHVDVSDDDDFDLNTTQDNAARKRAKQRTERARGIGGGGGGSGGSGSRVAAVGKGEYGRVATLVLDVLKALVVDSPESMSSSICRLHPFPDRAAMVDGLEALASALEVRKQSQAQFINGNGTSSALSHGADNVAELTTEVWQAAERLVEGMGDDTAPASRSAGSLLASLSHLREALRRYSNVCGDGGGGRVGGGGVGVEGAWKAMSAGPTGAALARTAVGAVVRLCRSERPPAVHLEATRLAGEIGAVDPYDVELAEKASARGGGRLEGSGSKDAVGSLEDPLAGPKLKAFRLLASYLMDSDEDLSFCALCTAKALLSRGGGVAGDMIEALLKDTSADVRAVLKPFTERLARMNTARMASGVWRGLYGSTGEELSRNEATIGASGGAGTGGVAGSQAEVPVSALSADVWTTAGKTFPQWVCRLTSVLLLECYAGVAFQCFKNAASKGRNEDPTFPPRPREASQGAELPLQGQDEVLALFCALCRRKAEIAACLFPAIIYDLVRSHHGRGDMSGDGTGPSGGGSNRAASEISTAFRDHLFSADGPKGPAHAQAVALGIEALNYLRGRQIAAFLRRHHGSKSRKGGVSSAAGSAGVDGEDPEEVASRRWLGWSGEGREGNGGGGLPFGFYLDLDALGVARAAARCGAHCSALFYSEAWIEGKFGEAAGITASRWRDQGEGSGSEGLDCLVDDFVGLTNDSSSADAFGRGPQRLERARAGEEKREVERLLLDVFSSLPEPDSIYGVPTPAADLSAQATVYAHEGGWQKTLPAYDTLLQHPSIGEAVAAAGGASGATGGGVSGIGLQTGIASSLQRMGLPHVLEHYLRGLRVGPASLRGLPDLVGDLRDMQFESAWRMNEWDPALTIAAASTCGAVSGTSTAASSVCQASSAGGDGNESGTGRPVFHEHIMQALKSLRQRNGRVFASAVGHARALALTRLGSGGGGQEGGKGLYPCLVQLQCLTELEETFAVLSAGDSAGVGEHVDAAGALAERWRARSESVREHFESLEPVLALREAMLRVVHFERPGPRSRRLVLRHLLDTSEAARRVGHHSIAQGALHRFLQVSRAPPHRGRSEASHLRESAAEAMRCRLAEARVFWGKGEADVALRAARAVATKLCASGGKKAFAVDSGVGQEEREKQCLLSEALRLTGGWVAKTKSESSRETLESYLKPAVEAARTACGGVPMAAAAVIPIDVYNDSENAGGWGGLGAQPLLCAAHFTLAKYLADLHASVKGRVESPEWRAAGRVAESRQQEIAICNNKIMGIKREGKLKLGVDADFTDLFRHTRTLESEAKIDTAERAGVEHSVGTFLADALENYGKALTISREPDLRAVFAVVSLWFNNQSDPEVNRRMDDIAQTVPSYKFIPLTYQISSRVGSGDEGGFRAGVHRLILRLCREHPHHSLLQLLALANGEKVSGGGATQFRQNISMEKIQAAKGLLDELKHGRASGGSLAAAGASRASNQAGVDSSAEDLPALVTALERLVEAYIALAMASTTKFHARKTADIKFSAAVPKGQPTLDKCLWDRASGSGRGRGGRVMPGVTTRPPAIRPDADYRDTPTILRFKDSFSITDSGIHRPKIVHCTDSTGATYRQLVKGSDDIRQDAVMEQVFATVNSFLREDPAARKRRLRVFTYNIIPLSPDSGVLEWVEDTLPFGSFLVDRGAGKPGAHTRYFPKDWKHLECRKKLKEAENKRAAYAQVENNFHPAFRFFFLEKFPEPFAWYNSRLTFTRSAAVSSIVGYVLGIGDRHAHNILVHQRTAEVVHIDFGVTFEQGKVLSTPETVPFRLTRDVVDGMGVTGTEGAFRRACEAAMRVLRSDAPSVLTILEVLLHDPLYRWMLSPLAARQRQQDETRSESGANGARAAAVAAAAAQAAAGAGEQEDQGVGGEAAQRALARIKHKLQGYEDPNGDAMSVEGQVKLLINQARDPENLCRLFAGWAPWL